MERRAFRVEMLVQSEEFCPQDMLRDITRRPVHPRDPLPAELFTFQPLDAFKLDKNPPDALISAKWAKDWFQESGHTKILQ